MAMSDCKTVLDQVDSNWKSTVHSYHNRTLLQHLYPERVMDVTARNRDGLHPYRSAVLWRLDVVLCLTNKHVGHTRWYGIAKSTAQYKGRSSVAQSEQNRNCFAWIGPQVQCSCIVDVTVHAKGPSRKVNFGFTRPCKDKLMRWNKVLGQFLLC